MEQPSKISSEIIKSDTLWDVVVVGSGLGGIALSILLSRLGYRILIIERNAIGHFRVGESLDWEAPIFLKRLGLPIEKLVTEGKATYKHGAIASSVSQPGIEARFGFSLLFKILMGMVGRGKPSIHANRELIDVDLINMALSAGTTVVTGKATKIATENDRVTSVTLADGRQFTGKFYLDATGQASLFRRAFGIGQTTIGAKKVNIRARFPHAYDGTGTRIRTDDTMNDPAWIWDIHISQDVTDIGIVVTERDFASLRKQFSSLAEIFLHLTQKHEGLHWLAPLITKETEFWTCTFQDMVSHKSNGENWIAIGEAAFLVDALLSSGFTASLRTGFSASNIIKDALAKNSPALCPKKRLIYHEKASMQIRTVNQLLEVLWYQGRLRHYYSFMLNVASILTINFNLNHFHTRYIPSTIFGLKMLKLFHKTIDAFVPRYNNLLTKIAIWLGKTNRNIVSLPITHIKQTI